MLAAVDASEDSGDDSRPSLSWHGSYQQQPLAVHPFRNKAVISALHIQERAALVSQKDRAAKALHVLPFAELLRTLNCQHSIGGPACPYHMVDPPCCSQRLLG